MLTGIEKTLVSLAALLALAAVGCAADDGSSWPRLAALPGIASSEQADTAMTYQVASENDDTTAAGVAMHCDFANQVPATTVRFGFSTCNGGPEEADAFVRWAIDIPKAATILSARISVTAAAAWTTPDPKTTTIKRLVSDGSWDGSSGFSAYGVGMPFGNEVRAIPTSGSVAWSTGAWNDNTTYQSSDIKSLVQEFVNLSGYNPGAYFGVRINPGNGSAVTDSRTFDAFSSPNTGAQLNVTYYGGTCGDSKCQAAPNGPETCDDGNLTAGDGCSAGCLTEAGWTCTCSSSGKSTCSATRCGDGIKAGTEQCDDGNANECDGCLHTCVTHANTCGDGNTCSTEQCDDGNTADDCVCLGNCRVPYCGDGRTCGSEECDDGASNGQPGHCTSACKNPPPACGDGTPGVGEQCDDGGTIDDCTCLADCTWPRCGDELTCGAEQCDDGKNGDDCDGCLDDCTTHTNSCGDGIVCGTEECDDGGESATCNDDCTLSGCGDGKHNAAAGEGCDDHNTADDDGCSGTCQLEGMPVITESANAFAKVGRPYHYDEDGRAEATGAVPIVWSVVDGPAGLAIDAATGAVTWMPVEQSVASVTLKAENSVGQDRYTFDVTAQAGVFARIVTEPTPPEGIDALEVHFACDCVADPGPITAWIWDFGDGSYSVDSTISHFFPPGGYDVGLVVLDASGEIGVDSAFVTVAEGGNHPPAISLTAAPTAGQAPLVVQLAASLSDPDGDSVTSLVWSFGDDTPTLLDETSPTHTYERGIWTAKLTAIDSHGLASESRLDITATDENDAIPPRILSLPVTNGAVGAAYTYDSDGLPAARGSQPILWSVGKMVGDSLVGSPAGLEIDPATGRLVWTPAADEVGQVSIVLVARNGAGASVQEWSVQVTGDAAPAPEESGCNCATGARGGLWVVLACLAFRRRRARPGR